MQLGPDEEVIIINNKLIYIKNVNLLLPDGNFYKGRLAIEKNKIVRVAAEKYGKAGNEEDDVSTAAGRLAGRSPEAGQPPEDKTLRTEGLSADEKQVQVIDGQGGYCFPGMIDMHFHGCKGYDFCDGSQEALEEIAAYEASIGVTSICPATMTLPLQNLYDILENAARFQAWMVDSEAEKTCARLVGINMEGPFISPVKKGAQDSRYILPWNKETVRHFIEKSEGLVKVVGVAPEEQGISRSAGGANNSGAKNETEIGLVIKDGRNSKGSDDEKLKEKEFLKDIESLSKEIRISIAHSNADYQTAKRTFDAGASHAVHLYNAMTGLRHRDPGIVGAVYDSSHVTAELICDGVHVHPAMIRLTFEMLGKDRMVMISDSMRAAGMPDGEYSLGGQDVHVHGSLATMALDGAIAGSVTPLPDCVRYAVKSAGIPLEDALTACTRNPAAVLGIDRECGKIQEGLEASLVIWDQDLNQKLVMMRGDILYNSL